MITPRKNDIRIYYRKSLPQPQKEIVNPSVYIQSVVPRKYEQKFSFVNNDVLFLVITCKNYEATRVKALNETWGRYALNKVFLSDYTDFSKNIIGYNENVPNNYENVSYKIYEFFRDFEALGLLDFKYYVMVDDDTFIFHDRLMGFLDGLRLDKPTIIGRTRGSSRIAARLKHVYGVDKVVHFPLGGGGIVFNNSAIRTMCQYLYERDVKDLLFHGVGDVCIGIWAGECGIEMRKSRRFSQRHYCDDVAKVDNISFHYVKPEEFYFLDGIGK